MCGSYWLFVSSIRKRWFAPGGSPTVSHLNVICCGNKLFSVNLHPSVAAVKLRRRREPEGGGRGRGGGLLGAEIRGPGTQ